jgi:hypothetical protein
LFERATWALESRLGTFVSEASEALELAEASGDTAAIERATVKDFVVGSARFKHRWLDSNLLEYFEAKEGAK